MHDRTKKNLQLDFEVPMEVVEKMYKDTVNGASWLEMERKWYGGGYGAAMTDKDFDIAFRTVARYIQFNLSDLDDDERKMLYSRYLAVYQAAMLNNNLRDARNVLDSMARLAGLDKKNGSVTVEKSDGEDTITISFGGGAKKEKKD